MRNSPFGLDDLEKEQLRDSEIHKQEQDLINANFGKCFNSPSGKRVLEYLSKMTVDQPTWIPSAGSIDGESAIHHGFVREGQNSIVREIYSRVNQSKGK
jgi:hypothetical protein